jgi:hypothetical protein
MLAAVARKKTARTTSGVVVTLFLIALIGGLIFAVYRRKVAARNAWVITDLQKRVGMNVNNPMYKAAAPITSLDPNVKGKLVDVPDSEYEEAIGFTRNRSVYIQSTKDSNCTIGSNSTVGSSSFPASGIVFAIPMEEEYLEVLGKKSTPKQLCARPDPAGGTCKKVVLPGGGQFCRFHACPECGAGKSSAVGGCPAHLTRQRKQSVYAGFGEGDEGTEA